jgi:hypothetical protein
MVKTVKVHAMTTAWDAGNSGCPCGSGGGFDPSKPSWLYLINNPAAEITQIGITSNLKIRLSRHRSHGFTEVIDTEYYDIGKDAQRTESALKRAVSEHLGHPLSARIAGRTFEGFTEAWSSRELFAESLRGLRAIVLQNDLVLV